MGIERIERIDRTLVAKGKIVDYYQDTVKIPNGNMVLQEWDKVFMYTDQYVVDAADIEV